MSNNEKIFNGALGAVLQTQRHSWRERVRTENNSSVLKGGNAGQADILIYPDDMQPVIVETAFEGTRDIDGDAIERLGVKETFNGRDIMTAVAVKIPLNVRDITRGIDGMREWLEGGGELEYAVYSAVPGKQGETTAKDYDIRYPDGEQNSGRIRGTAQDLATMIELAATPDAKIKQVAGEVAGAVHGIGARMYNSLLPKTRAAIAKKVGQPADEHAMRVAACIWLNAASLHSKLAAARPGEIESLAQCKTLGKTAAAWESILRIDYHSVFRPALESLQQLGGREDFAAGILADLHRQTDAMNSLRLGGIADVSSDMFPKIAADQKITAAFYTKMEVAELLAGLAFNLIPDDGRNLKIADFACGTGALLKAAYRQVRRRAEFAKKDLDEVHKINMEECLHGADIQPIAAHLSVAGLASMRPEAEYTRSNIICADVKNGKTGSLDLLKAESLRDLFGGASATGVDNGKYDFRPADGTFDLCIMNPPYSRARGGAKLFAIDGLPEDQRELSVNNLNKLLRGSFADGQAGMASAFCHLADKKLKPGGVLATVLPLSAAGQGSWRAFRAYIMQNYSDIIVVGTATQNLQSFSADTNMGEMLVRARKNESGGNGDITFINLHRLPRTFVEAHETARALQNTKHGELKIGDYVYATCVKAQPKNGDAWGGVGVRNHELAYIAMHLFGGKFTETGLLEEHNFALPMKTLDNYVGPTHHLIGHLQGKEAIGAFGFRGYRLADRDNLSLWQADHKMQTRMTCMPTHSGEVVDGRQELGRKMMAKASTLFIARNLSMSSQALAAAMTETKCMGGSAWNALQIDKESRAAYCLWFNSLPGLICRWQCGGRQHPGRARMQLDDLENFPAPDFAAQTKTAKAARTIANKAYPQLAKLQLMPCSYAWRDDNRKAIDAIVLKMLGITIPPAKMQSLREMWCREPSVHGGTKTIRKTLQADNLL